VKRAQGAAEIADEVDDKAERAEAREIAGSRA
jgi:hypothetical protein